jgi:hypothetical protein
MSRATNLEFNFWKNGRELKVQNVVMAWQFKHLQTENIPFGIQCTTTRNNVVLNHFVNIQTEVLAYHYEPKLVYSVTFYEQVHRCSLQHHANVMYL